MLNVRMHIKNYRVHGHKSDKLTEQHRNNRKIKSIYVVHIEKINYFCSLYS